MLCGINYKPRQSGWIYVKTTLKALNDCLHVAHDFHKSYLLISLIKIIKKKNRSSCQAHARHFMRLMVGIWAFHLRIEKLPIKKARTQWRSKSWRPLVWLKKPLRIPCKNTNSHLLHHYDPTPSAVLDLPWKFASSKA